MIYNINLNLNNVRIHKKWHEVNMFSDAGDIEEIVEYVFRTVGTNFVNKNMAIKAAKEANDKIYMVSQATGDTVICASANTFDMLYDLWENLNRSVTIVFEANNE